MRSSTYLLGKHFFVAVLAALRTRCNWFCNTQQKKVSDGLHQGQLTLPPRARDACPYGSSARICNSCHVAITTPAMLQRMGATQGAWHVYMWDLSLVLQHGPCCGCNTGHLQRMETARGTSIKGGRNIEHVANGNLLFT